MTSKPFTADDYACGIRDLQFRKGAELERRCNEIADSLHREMTRQAVSSAALRIGLEESVRLQSHYADLLNMHDGGERRPFKNADEWIARLRETGKLPKG